MPTEENTENQQDDEQPKNPGQQPPMDAGDKEKEEEGPEQQPPVQEHHEEEKQPERQPPPEQPSGWTWPPRREYVSPLRVIHDRKPTANIIAGRIPVMEALRAGTMIERVVILAGVKGSAIEKIKQMAKRNRVPYIEVGKQRFRDLVSDTTTQGVVAVVGSKTYVEIDDILKAAQERNEPPFVLILDEIEDPQNLGALIRTAECTGVHGAIIPKHHAASVNQTVARTSAGASEHLPIAKVVNIANTIDELKQKGMWVVGTDAEAEKVYTQIDYIGPTVVVVGNEGSGIRQLVKEKCDFVVKIPLYGKIQSLNASVAGALVMYEVARKRRGF